MKAVVYDGPGKVSVKVGDGWIVPAGELPSAQRNQQALDAPAVRRTGPAGAPCRLRNAWWYPATDGISVPSARR